MVTFSYAVKFLIVATEFIYVLKISGNLLNCKTSKQNRNINILQQAKDSCRLLGNTLASRKKKDLGLFPGTGRHIVGLMTTENGNPLSVGSIPSGRIGSLPPLTIRIKQEYSLSLSGLKRAWSPLSLCRLVRRMSIICVVVWVKYHLNPVVMEILWRE